MLELLERLVIAIERIAEASESRAASIALSAQVLEEHREAMTEQENFPAATDPEIAETAANSKMAEEADFPATSEGSDFQTTADREQIKQKLDALGVVYPAKARTATLMQLLEDSQNAAPVEEYAVDPVEALKKIRDGLKQVALKSGTDAARELLRVHAGGAENVSAIDPKFYKNMLKALGEEI